MSTSGKRSSQRSRRPPRSPSNTTTATTTTVDQSSPSRAAKRRRKMTAEPTSEAADEDASGLTNTNALNDDDTLIAQITECLKATYEVQASKDYANDKEESTVEAYAKIAAKDWTYYIRQLEVKLGRRPPNDSEAERESIHIDLGPSKTFSRLTATIYFDTAEEDWFLQSNGRISVRVNGKAVQKDDKPHALSSGEVVEINGVEMMFVLPTTIQSLTIHEMYIQRLGFSARDKESRPLPPVKSSPGPEQRHALPAPPSAADNASQGRPPSSRGQGFQQPIAPAPPDYKRPGTPPSAAKSRTTVSQHKSPAYGSSGTMLMNPNDVDLSLYENKHIKPLFSYAQMISQAIDSTTDKKLNLNGIYQYITEKYAYYRVQQGGGWQNSIRHNLSLSKAFVKSPRSTDEPGKGMKWEIIPEQYEEMMRAAWKVGRGGHRGGSSAPSSPNQSNQANNSNGAATGKARKRKASTAASTAASPPPSASLHASTMTPDRSGSARFSAGSFQDGSPLPRSRKAMMDGDSVVTSFAASDTLPPRSPPTLSSSYIQDENPSFVTPAPLRVHPRLAPPSTAQRPSQHMPTSSPAPFWKFADIQSTPLKCDFSPSKPAVKVSTPTNNSSSPAPATNEADVDPDVATELASPLRSTRGATQETTTMEDEEESHGYDLFK